MKLGYSTWAMPTLPIDTTVAHLAELGFDAIEIGVLPRFTTALDTMDSAERKRIPHLLREHGLALSAVSAYLSMMETDADQFAQNLDYVQRAVDLAAEWMAGDVAGSEQPIVVSGFGGSPGDLDTQFDTLVERLDALGDYAQKRGVVMALEHHVGNAVEAPEQVIAILERVSSPAIRINFDISHFNVVGIPIEESVTKMVPYAAHTHVKDERGRAPEHQYLVPGEGEFEYGRYLKAMDAAGYTGVISTEISMMVQRRPDYDPLATATQSYRVLSKAFDAAGIQRERTH